jgi:hypothetical protein
MTIQFTLESRVARCRRRADAGEAVMMILSPDEIDRARELIGPSPVIAATGPEARRFLEFLSRKPRRKRSASA